MRMHRPRTPPAALPDLAGAPVARHRGGGRSLNPTHQGDY